MITEQDLKNAFNSGRSYSGMPNGFNDFVQEKWKYENFEDYKKHLKL